MSCLTALLRISSTVLNKSGENEYICLVLDHRRKAFDFSSLSIMLAVGFLYITFISPKYVIQHPFC